MRKAVLVYNPDSGGNRARRQREELDSVLSLLRGAEVAAEIIFAASREEARERTGQAIAAGCDTVFACGGDGTVHNLVQVLANSPAALGVLPVGTANALAHDLGLPLHLVKAARAALHAKPRRVALGKVEYQNLKGDPEIRYFTVAAGVGVDAHLFYKLHTAAKQRMGMAAYYAKAWHLWFTYPMTRFRTEYIESGSGERCACDVTELLGVRIRNFGGVLQELAPGASLERNDLRLIFCRTASRLAYLLYVTRGLLRSQWRIPGIDLSYSGKVACQYLPASTSTGSVAQPRIYVEADGELLGTLPAEISVIPDALTILVPG